MQLYYNDFVYLKNECERAADPYNIYTLLKYVDELRIVGKEPMCFFTIHLETTSES